MVSCTNNGQKLQQICLGLRPMNLSLEGKKALVCGSSQGIGFAVAEQLALMGAHCTLFARNKKSLEKKTVYTYSLIILVALHLVP